MRRSIGSATLPGLLLLMSASALGAEEPARFLPDAQCTACHADLAKDFPSIGMARSFGMPEPGSPAVEDWTRATFEHALSGDRYRFARRDDSRLWFERWQVDASGREIHRLEIPVDFVLGSGNRSRVYLYRTPSGELFQLPLAWYAQERSFAMAPGYDRRDHDGIGRRVRRECMFCHTANPETATPLASGWDARHAPQTFPGELPHGIGCQRCHGPGSRHATLAWSGVATTDAVRAAIVNPARLEPPRARDVCSQCHLQPAVAQPGLRRVGKSDYAFRPGEKLSDSILAVRVAHGGSDGGPVGERFEINHHATRLIESRCFLASPEEGERGDRSDRSRARLACFSCHDPHRKPQPADRAARVRQVCLSCHPSAHAVSEAAAGVAGASNAAQALPAVSASPAPTAPTAPPPECSSCHMPERRPRDVVRVTMTDHKIVRRPEPATTRIAALAEEDPVLLDVAMLDACAAGLDAGESEFYRTLAVVRAQGRVAPAAIDQLVALLDSRPTHLPQDAEVLLDLASALLGRARFADAETVLRAALLRQSSNPNELLIREWLGVALAGQGKTAPALEFLRPLANAEPPRPEALYNLGLLERAIKDPAQAVRTLERVVALRPYQSLAWLQLGMARREAGGETAATALQAFERAVAVEPASGRATAELARELVRLERREEALRILRHGIRVVRTPTLLESALAGLEGTE